MSIVPFLVPGLVKCAESWGLEPKPIPFEEYPTYEALAEADEYREITRYYEENILGVTPLMRIARGYIVPPLGRYVCERCD